MGAAPADPRARARNRLPGVLRRRCGSKDGGRWAGYRFILVALAAVPVLLAAVTAGGRPADCTDEQKRALEQHLVGRVVTAKIDLPLINYPGLWVYWNGQYDVQSYARSLKMGPPSVPQGATGRIVELRFQRKWIGVDVNGSGLFPPHDWEERSATMTAEEAAGHGSQVAVTFGRKLTESDCRIESVLRALTGVMEIEGVGEATDEATPDVVEALAGGAESEDREPAAAAEPGLRIIAAQVVPTVLAPGDTLRLDVSFEVSGLTPPQSLEVTEERQLFFDERPLFSAPRTGASRWGNGTHTTTLEFRFPDAASAGVYTFRVTLRADGMEASSEALFQVDRRP